MHVYLTKSNTKRKWVLLFTVVDDAAIDSTQSPDPKKPSESPDQSEESVKRETGDPQVGSTVNNDEDSNRGNEDVEMATATSSEAEQRTTTSEEQQTTPVTSGVRKVCKNFC